MKTLKIALLGLGTVGSGVVKILTEEQDLIQRRTGVRFEICGVLVRDLYRQRSEAEGLPLTDSFEAILSAEPDILVEVMGSLEPTYGYVRQALARGIPVVSANKLMVSTYHSELSALADRQQTRLLFEAGVAGGIPIIRLLQGYLGGERITRVTGILNGTTNYILSRMGQAGIRYAEALKEAQQLGYAEADPESDVEGYDALFKLMILAQLAFNVQLAGDSVHREGIRRVHPADFRFAAELGCAVKLLANLQHGTDGLEAWVAPALVSETHPLWAVGGCLNGIQVQGAAMGTLTLTGAGAGGLATGSAVVADLIEAAKGLTLGGEARASAEHRWEPTVPACEQDRQHLLRITLRAGADERTIHHILNHAHLGTVWRSVWNEPEGPHHLALLTGPAAAGSVHAAVRQLEGLAGVAEAVSYRLAVCPLPQSQTGQSALPAACGRKDNSIARRTHSERKCIG